MATTRATETQNRGTVVLVYHRIGPSGSDPLGLNVTPAHLAEHLEVLGSGRYHPVSLAQLTRGLREETLPRNAIAVTFDDGYRGVLTSAKPLLEKSGVPATAFIPTGFVGETQEFWWEELDKLVLGVTNGKSSWRRGTSRVVDLADSMLRRRGALTRLYLQHFRRLRLLEPAERQAALAELAAGLPRDRSPRTARLPMSSEDLIALAKNDLVAIGAHTITHPVLALLSTQAQEHEIAGSKAELEHLVGSPVRSFAYPYGGPTEYGDVAVAAVRRAGFDHACANVPHLARPGADVFQIPRFVVHDWNGDKFESFLQRWLSGKKLKPRRWLVSRKVAP